MKSQIPSPSFTISEEVRGNGAKYYWVGQWAYHVEGAPWFNEKSKCFTTLQQAKDWVDEQTVVSYKEVYRV